MSKPISILVAVATFVVAAVVGVVVVRAVQDDPASEATPPAEALFDTDGTAIDIVATDVGTEPIEVSDVVAAPERLIPVIEPTAIGIDDSVGDALLQQLPPDAPVPAGLGGSGALPPAIAGSLAVTGTPAVATAGDEGDDDTSDGTAPAATSDATTPGEAGEADATATPHVDDLVWFDGLGDLLLRLPPLWFDPCAGITPDSPVPEGCPEGYPAVFGGTFEAPPEPFIFWARGHATSPDGTDRVLCPASTPAPSSDEAAMTLYSRTPLTEVTARIRPYGSDDAWTDVAITPTPAPDREWWLERYDTLEYDLDWATIPICLNVPRDPTVAYEIRATATDTFGQPVESNLGVIVLDDPTRRPPTTGTVTGLSSVATVTARSVLDGMVQFRSRTVTGPDDDLECADAPIFDTGILNATSPVYPIGIYDPAYNWAHVARIPIPPGSQIVVCAEIFPTTNPLTPTGTDRLLFSAPTQERPRIVLQGIRRLGDRELDRIDVAAGRFDTESGVDPCVSSFYSNAEPLAAGQSYSVEQTLWECDDAAIPVDGDGAVTVPVRLTRRIGSELVAEEVAIPIQLQECLDPDGCGRPREWYEVPIPSGDRTMCGSGFGSDGCDPDRDLDGIAVVRVDYTVVPATDADEEYPARGTVTLVDQVDAAAASGSPRVQVADITVLPAPDDQLERSARLEFVADRPVQLSLTVTERLDDTCATLTPITTEGFASEISVEIDGLCAGASYDVRFVAADEDGNEYDFERGAFFHVRSIQAPMTAQLQFLGGPDVPEFGFIYRLDISIEGQRPTAYWFEVTGDRGRTGASCYRLAGTTARSRGFWNPTYLSPNDLDVRVTVDITTTGEGDCSGTRSTGLGEITLTGSFTPEEYLTERTLVLETEAGATLPMRLTLTRDGPWRQPVGS